MKQGWLAAALILGLPLAAQHHEHPAGTAAAPQAPAAGGHHDCLAQEREALERGKGFGMAMAAQENGYPGPRHLLARKQELKLTPEQQRAISEIEAAMKQKALARGREVLLAEHRLAEMFRQNRPEPELREESFRIASLRAELRWVHLAAHLAARKVLTPEQLAAYRSLDPR